MTAPETPGSGSRPPARRRPLAVLFLTVFVDLLGFGIVIPILPLYAKGLHASPALVGLLLASFSAMQLVFAPIWGMTSDRVGRRPVLLVSIFGSVVAYAVYARASSLWMLFAARSFAGLCGANISTAQAYIADVTSDRDRAKGMGLIGAAIGMGFVVGPALGGAVSGRFGPRAPFWVASALAAINFLSAALLLPEPRARGERRTAPRPRLAALGQAFRTPRLAPLLVIFFLVTFAFANLEGTFSLWLAEPPFGFSARQVGYVFTYVGVLLAVVQGGLIGRLARRFGEPALVVLGAALLSLGMFLLPTAHSRPLLVLVLLPTILGNGINTPTTSALISRAAPSERQGEMLGVAQSLSALARILGPWVGGVLFGQLGKNAPYFAGGAVMACGCLLALSRLSDFSAWLRGAVKPADEAPARAEGPR